jgi:hypothetical protein
MDWTNVLIIAATLLGPVFAVQAQKWIERSREERQRKIRLFETLMSTRGDNLSFDHKRALNMIDIVFSDTKSVTDAWHNYLDTLITQANETNYMVVGPERERKLIELLKEMGNNLGYDLNELTLKRGYYTPEAHGNFEREHEEIRKKLIGVLNGNPINMAVTSFAVDKDALQAQINLQQKLASAISDDGELKVTSRKTS